MFTKIALAAVLILAPLSVQAQQEQSCPYPYGVQKQLVWAYVEQKPDQLSWFEMTKSETKTFVDWTNAKFGNQIDADTVAFYSDLKEPLAVVLFAKDDCIITTFHAGTERVMEMVSALTERRAAESGLAQR